MSDIWHKVKGGEHIHSVTSTQVAHARTTRTLHTLHTHAHTRTSSSSTSSRAGPDEDDDISSDAYIIHAVLMHRALRKREKEKRERARKREKRVRKGSVRLSKSLSTTDTIQTTLSVKVCESGETQTPQSSLHVQVTADELSQDRPLRHRLYSCGLF
ncbi:hypothetical protein WMY93_034045 [Mugilogobius chulae]|uniref:Uncharacterized protein n=1 Tax=Mugilogobius chulae TaxID=88201 RepID=A0AAW0MFP7_9GOBI